MLPDVPQARSSEEGIGQGMAEHVAVRVTEETLPVLDLHAAQMDRSLAPEPMDIDPQANSGNRSSAHGWAPTPAPSQERRATRSSAPVTFRLRGSPSTAATGSPSARTKAASSSASRLVAEAA